ncbi:MAG: hypothetical protein WCS88_00785 [Patescibacteria group bacterium]
MRVKQVNPDRQDLYFVGTDEETIMAEAVTGTINGRCRLASSTVVSEATVARIFGKEVLAVAICSVAVGNSAVFALGVAA